ncbi:hypothetical protein [Rheinheimera sp. NSM]|uniref:hypothetical protein n=1 Tax=Rheinheimera sp. NSM TaxID=3457884 RepID=UPI00403552F6
MPISSEYFRDVVLREFKFLEKEFDLKSTPCGPKDEQFTVCYIGDTIQVIVEGISWGENARVAIGSCIGFENYDLYDLVKAKTGEYPEFESVITLDQIAQLPQLAILLKEHAKPVLSGDFSIFQAISEIVHARAKSFDDGVEHFVI